MKINICDITNKQVEVGSESDDIQSYTFCCVYHEEGTMEPEIDVDISDEVIEEVKERFTLLVKDFIKSLAKEKRGSCD